MADRRGYPRQLMIELSRSCNLHCYNCYHENAPGVIGLSVFTDLIRNIARDYGKRKLPVLCPWFLSEPMMTPGLDEYLRIASLAGYTINLTTNGTIASKWEKLLCPEINYHLIVFSVDGDCQQTYGAIRSWASLATVLDTIDSVGTEIIKANLYAPICVKLTNKGVEWKEICDFVGGHLAKPYVKMVSVSRAFNDDDGPAVRRHQCRYLDEYMIIQHDLRFSPCCMRGRAIASGLGTVDVDHPMQSFFGDRRAHLSSGTRRNRPMEYCLGCQSAFTGEAMSGTVDGRAFGIKGPVMFKQDFYNTFYFNPTWGE
jgi:hypothetical protein